MEYYVKLGFSYKKYDKYILPKLQIAKYYIFT